LDGNGQPIVPASNADRPWLPQDHIDFLVRPQAGPNGNPPAGILVNPSQAANLILAKFPNSGIQASDFGQLTAAIQTATQICSMMWATNDVASPPAYNLFQAMGVSAKATTAAAPGAGDGTAQFY